MKITMILALTFVSMIAGIALAESPATFDTSPPPAEKTPFDRGNAFLSGSILFISHGGDAFTNDKELVFQPGISFFLIKGIALGGELDLAYNLDNATERYSASVGPALIFFSPRKMGEFFPFIEASIKLSDNGYEANSYSNSTKGGTHFSFAIGTARHIDKKLAMTFKSEFSFYNYSRGFDDDVTGFHFGIGVGIIGFL